MAGFASTFDREIRGCPALRPGMTILIKSSLWIPAFAGRTIRLGLSTKRLHIDDLAVAGP